MPPVAAISSTDPSKDPAGQPKASDSSAGFQTGVSTSGSSGVSSEKLAGPLPPLPKVKPPPPPPPPPAPPPLPSPPPSGDAGPVLDNSSYSSGANLQIWDGVTSAQPGSDQTQTEKELNRPIAAAQALSANWTNWGLDKDISFSNPPSSLPPEAQAVIKYVAANPALMTALDTAGSKDKTDGTITKSNVDAFAKQATSDAKDASKTVTDWLQKNSGAGDQSKALVQSAGIVMANQALASGSDSDHQGGKVGNDGMMTNNGLAQLGSQNPGLSSALGDASKLWGQPGMFKLLDTGGTDIAFNQPDGNANAKNIGDWITKEAPGNDADFANTLNQAAVENTVAGIGNANIGKDVFTDPSKYTGAQKAAAMVQLGDTSAKISASVDDGIYNSGFNAGNVGDSGINSDPNQVQGDIAQKIQQLQQDPDVQAYLSQTLPGAQQAIMNSDSSVRNASANFFNSTLRTGKALNDDLDKKDSKGNPASPATALESFTQQATFYDGAFGTGGKTLGLLNPMKGGNKDNGPSQLNEMVKASGQEGNLESFYTNNILNTKVLTDSVDGGADLGSAINLFSSAAATFGTALDPTFIANNAQQTQSNFAANSTDAILGSASTDEINNAFGDKGGNEDQTNAIVQQVQTNAPDLFKTSDGTTIAPDKVATLVRQTTDLVRNGIKVQDALSKVADSVTAPSGANVDAYKAGALHVLSSVIGGGVLAAKAVAGTSSPTADAGVAAASAQALGTLTEGTAKYGGTAAKQVFTGPALQTATATWKNIENSGKVVGNIGGAVSGALNIVSGIGDLKSGDKVGGGLNIGAGAAGALAGVAGATEGSAGLLSAAGAISSTVADSVAAASSVIGVAGSAVGSLAGLGYLISQVVKGAQQVNTFDGQTVPTLNQYGVTGGPERAPANPPPPPPPAADHGQGPLEPPTHG